MRSRMFAAVALILVGLVWIGQGTGVLQGSSFMVGEPGWAVAGVGMAAAGVLVGAWRLIRPPRV